VHYSAYAEAHKQTTAADYDVLETELANIFAAIEQARISEEWSAVVSTVYALLEGCLRVRGYWDESVKYGRVLAEAARKAGDKRAEGWAWTSAIGWILIQQGHYEQGREAVEKGLQAFREAGSEWGCWQARRYLGHAYHAGGDLNRARATYLSALRDAKAAYSARFPTLALLRRYVRFVRRNRHRGKWTWGAFVATRRADYRSITAHYYNDLGNLALEEGRLDEARAYFEQALAHFRQLGREMEIGIVLNGLAHVARKQGAWEEARRLYTTVEGNSRGYGSESGY
jgi:tetratricopeptide (TPR) repeat protein